MTTTSSSSQSDGGLTVGTKVALGFGCFTLVAVIIAIWFLAQKVLRRPRLQRRVLSDSDFGDVGPRWLGASKYVKTGSRAPDQRASETLAPPQAPDRIELHATTSSQIITNK